MPFFFFNQEVHMGKKSDQHQSYKSFVQGCSGSKLKAKYGYKTIIPGLLATGAEREGQQERSFLPLGPVLRWDVGVDCHEAKRPQSPCFWPLWKGGNLVPGLFPAPLSIRPEERIVWEMFVSTPLAPGSLSRCGGAMSPMRATAMGCLTPGHKCLQKVTKSYT